MSFIIGFIKINKTKMKIETKYSIGDTIYCPGDKAIFKSMVTMIEVEVSDRYCEIAYILNDGQRFTEDYLFPSVKDIPIIEE